MPLYLADSSIWIAQRRARLDYLPELIGDRVSRGEIATCVPVALEVLVGPANASAYDEEWAALWQHLHWLPLDAETSERALSVQRELAHTTAGAHRRRPIDYLVAACAERAGPEVVLWHWDADLDVICRHTGQPQESEHARAHERDAGTR